MDVDTNLWAEGKGGSGSAVIDMQEGDDHSDYGDFNTPAPGMMDESDEDTRQRKMQKSFTDDMRSGMSSFLWQSGKEKAQQAFTSYAKVDILRPYYDVEPNEVLKRLLHSFIPKKPGSDPQRIPSELYGPTMLVFTLIALLLFEMKMSNHQVGEGTLMGSAIGVCFMYWLGTSALIWTMAYICNTRIRAVQILSLLGYSLSGHCVVIFLGTLIHTTHDHIVFYLLWAIFGGLCTLRMVSVLVSRTPGYTQRMIVCGSVAGLHLLFLLYLHFAYHQVVEDISHIIDDSPLMKLHDNRKHQVEDDLSLRMGDVKKTIDAIENDKIPLHIQARNVVDAVANNTKISVPGIHDVREGVQKVLRNAADVQPVSIAKVASKNLTSQLANNETKVLSNA